MDDLTRLLLAIVLVVGLTLLGGLAPLVRSWSRPTLRAMLAFGTGVLLGAAFLHMIPESFYGLTGKQVGIGVLGGFLVIYLLERFMHHPHEGVACSVRHMGFSAYCGIMLHSLIDGLALGAGLAMPTLTLAVTLAIVLHKLPASLALTGILLNADYSRKRIIWLLVLFSLSTPIGAVIAFYVLKDLSAAALPWAIAVSAGTFLAIATADLMPQVHAGNDGRLRNLAALFLGIFVIAASDHFVGHAHHGHAHGDHDHHGHDHGDHHGHDHGDHSGHDHGDHSGHDHGDSAGHDHGDHSGHDHGDHSDHDHDDHAGHDH